MSDITQCTGYKSLREAVDRDHEKQPKFHDYEAKFNWVIERAQHYAEKTGLAADVILDAWEKDRTYWYMNFYQNSKQPEITGATVRIFQTVAEMVESIGNAGFRCPACEGVTSNPYECNSGLPAKGLEIEKKKKPKICDWKAYGLFGHMGKGITVFVVEKVKANNIFMPLAWEKPA